MVQQEMGRAVGSSIVSLPKPAHLFKHFYWLHGGKMIQASRICKSFDNHSTQSYNSIRYMMQKQNMLKLQVTWAPATENSDHNWQTHAGSATGWWEVTYPCSPGQCLAWQTDLHQGHHMLPLYKAPGQIRPDSGDGSSLYRQQPAAWLCKQHEINERSKLG